MGLTFRDIVLGGPLQRGLFHLRYQVLDAIHYRQRSPDQAAAVAAIRALDAPVVAFTVAFNIPEAVALLSDAMARLTPSIPLIVCDNSTDPEASRKIRAFCEAAGRTYCRLPKAPLVKFHSSRSHATALNWILRNLILPAGVRKFATLDHDLVPLQGYDFAAKIKDQPCYGYVRRQDSSRAWYLWPGFAIFDLDRIKPSKINFGTDRMLGLDTGGRMWGTLYRHMDEASFVPAHVGEGVVEFGEEEHLHLVFDVWLHVGQVSYRNGNLAVLAELRRRLELDPASLSEIVVR